MVNIGDVFGKLIVLDNTKVKIKNSYYYTSPTETPVGFSLNFVFSGFVKYIMAVLLPSTMALCT